VLAEQLKARGVKESSLEDIHSQVEEEVGEAVAFAQNSPWPDKAEAYTDVFAMQEK